MEWTTVRLKKRTTWGFSILALRVAHHRAMPKKPRYLPEKKEFQLLRLHTSTTYMFDWIRIIEVTGIFQYFCHDSSGHFGERSLLRGGDCAVPEAPKRDDMTIVGLGLIDLSRFFGNYFTTLKVTSYRKPRCKEWIWRQRKCLNKNNSIWIPWHIWSCKGGLGAFYLWRPRDYWTCCFLSSIRVWGGVGDNHLKGGQVQL